MNKMEKSKIDDFLEKAKEFLNENGFEFIDTYCNGESGFWGFDKERTQEISFKLNEMPDEESIEDFQEYLKDTKKYAKDFKKDNKTKGL